MGVEVAGYVRQVDHWIAFGLLAFLGVRMVRAALTEDDEDAPDKRRRGIRELLILALATSCDALAVGLSLALLPINILLTVAVIGVTTFAFSLLGVRMGQRSGTRFGSVADVMGGVAPSSGSGCRSSTSTSARREPRRRGGLAAPSARLVR